LTDGCAVLTGLIYPGAMWASHGLTINWRGQTIDGHI
jgi:hypothetical protein